MSNRRAVRSGRSYLLWALIGFVVPQLALGLAIDWKLPEIRDATFSYKRRQLRRGMAEHQGEPLVLALGSSRTRMGLLASRLHLSAGGKPVVAYNYAIPGAGPLTQLVTLRRLLNDGIRPEALLVEVMPAQFSLQPGRPIDEKNLDGGRLQASELAPVVRLSKVPRMLVATWLAARCLPCYWYAAELGLNGTQVPESRRPLGPEPPRTDGCGWEAGEVAVSAERRREKTAYAMGQYQDFCSREAVAPEAVRELRLLLDLCRDRGILVHLVVAPEGSQFRRELYAPAFLGALDRTLTDVCGEYGVALTNAREWLADQQFYDAHHQLPEGAAEFTDRLGRTLHSLENMHSMPAPRAVGFLSEPHRG